MKLKELAIEGFGVHRNLNLGRFGDGLSVVYGENGAGKSTAREFICKTLFGFDSLGSNSHRALAGRICVSRGDHEFELSRDIHSRQGLRVRSLDSNYVERFDSMEHFAGQLNSELYETVYSFSFRETASNARRLCAVLQSQLGVPSGPSAAGDHSDYLNWQRESAARRDRLESIQTSMDSIRKEKTHLLAQIDSQRHSHQARIADLETRVSRIISRINELQTSSLPDQLANVEHEIAQLRLLIDNAQSRVKPIPVETTTDRYSSLYLRLDEFDSQIGRWRLVQSDIQDQRVRLRDEMLIWNELTLDSDEHPYHVSRAILVSLESKVDEAERNANLWRDVGGSRVDTSQMAKTLGHLCQSMREDLYGLCNELAQQYKFIRHKAAAAELKQLRRCYSEMGKNIDRLVKQRESLIRELRAVDPAGADAIVRAELNFCQCAQHEGYLEARRRLVGPLPTVDSHYAMNPPDLTSERAQLVALEQQRSELRTKLTRCETEHQDLENQLTDLARQRDGLLGEAGTHDLNLKIRALDSELQNLIDKFNALRQRIDLDRDYVPTRPHPVLERACELLARITANELTQAFLSDPGVTPQDANRIEIQVRDRLGKVLNLSALEPSRQDQVYLSLVLAAKEHLQRNNIETPTIIDDAFSRIPSDQATAMLTTMNEFASGGHQIIALTQHRYLAERIPGLPVFEIPPTLPSIHPVADPERSNGLPPVVTPLRETDWSSDPFNYEASISASSSSRPYPLSKYPRHTFNGSVDDRAAAVTFPFPQSTPGSFRPYRQDSVASNASRAPSTVASVSVNSIGDRLGYVSSISESLPLGKVGFFDAQQLRQFESSDILTVGDLLAMEPGQVAPLGFHPDQWERWQSQLWLLINVPGMRINDARVLVACGILAPDQLETSHPQQLLERINRFLATSEGRRFAGDREPISLDRINGWYRSLDATRTRWADRSRRRHTTGQRSSDYTERQHDNSGDHPYSRRAARPARSFSMNAQTERPARQPAAYQRETPQAREPRLARPPRMNTPERKIVPRLAPASATESSKPRTTQSETSTQSSGTGNKKLKFYLDLNDHIEAAPAIGPKTAERFEKIGVVSVADFLKQTAESMALKIKFKRMSADVIRQWQQQARLVCRVPNLRGHDAQLLVACDITEPEELATMQPQALFDIIGPFSESKDGMKIIRNGKQPDLAEITDWISWAEHTRSLQAA